MPERQQTSLKFPLEETVWFEKGHEVEDLLSISLDPNINIMDEEEFVVLKGTLELSGEYHHSPGNTAAPAAPETNRHYIQNVEIRNDEVGEFSHRFPVDITIPKRRIANIGELEIEIYSFDYALPENDRLQVLADIYINGLYEDQDELIVDKAHLQEANESAESSSTEERSDLSNQAQSLAETEEAPAKFNQDELNRPDIDEEAQDEEREEVAIEFFQKPDDVEGSSELLETNQTDNELYEPFDVEARMLPELEEKVEEKNEVEQLTPFQHQLPQLADAPEEKVEQSEIIEVEAEREEAEPLESGSIAEGEQREEVEVIEEQQLEREKAEMGELEEKAGNEEDATSVASLLTQTPKFTLDSMKERRHEQREKHMNQESSSIDYLESSPYEVESSSFIESMEEKKAKKKKKDKYQSISFADFFARKEEESVSKMRVRLVQQGDSLENLADRYNVTTQQIARVNRLGDEDEVYEGQVLHIPDKILPLKRK